MKVVGVAVLFVCTNVVGQNADSIAGGVYHWDQLVPIKEDTRVRRQVLEGGTVWLSHFEVHASTLKAGEAPHPPHSHVDEEELIIVKEGKLKVTIGGRSELLGAGSVAYALPGDEHGVLNGGSGDATYYILKYKSRAAMRAERGQTAGGSFMINWDTVIVKKTDKGQRREFFNRATTSLEKFEMHTTALDPGLDSHAPHNHREEEVILILRGHVTMHIADKTLAAGPGDIVFLPSMVLHNLVNTGSERCEYFAFQWRN